MNWRQSLVFILGWLVPVAPALAQEGVILFTGSANGAIRNCLCPDKPLGGLERRAQAIAHLRGQYPDLLLIDNGDNFIEYLADGVKEVITGAFELMAYDLVNLGDQDITFGSSAYLEMPAMIKAYGGAVTITKGDLTYSIMPLLHPRATRFYPEEIFKPFALHKWEEQLQRWMQTELPKSTVRILLSHAGFDTDKKIAADYPEIDLIVGGHSQTVMSKPARINGVTIVHAGGNAGYLGEYHLSVKRGRVKLKNYELHEMTLSLPEHPGVMELIDRLVADH